MLELDSDKRIHAEQALAHPYLAQYADPSDEPSSLPYDQTFEDYDLTVDQWKGKEICLGSCSMTSIHHVCLALPLRICLERGEKLQAACQAKLVPALAHELYAREVSLSRMRRMKKLMEN